MKKLVLKSTFDKGEVLTRAQLKKVMGGDGSEGSGGCGGESHSCGTFYNHGQSSLNYTCCGTMDQCLTACYSTYESCYGCL